MIKLFEKIRIHSTSDKLRVIFCLNKPIFIYGKKSSKFFCSFRLNNLFKYNQNKSDEVFYLKVNRNIDDTFINLQYWIDIVNITKGKAVIMCDNPLLIKRILNTIIFPKMDIEFIKSVHRPFKKVLKKQKIAIKWINAACAHLTVFWHAQKHNYINHWNIDADDALFLMSPQRAVSFLKTAKDYADTNKLNLFSFDFWATKTKGRHWSFGITYQKNNIDYFKLLTENKINWNDYKKYTTVHNIDWVYTFLRDIGKLNIKTFYTDYLYFIHWGRFLGDMRNSYIVYWENGKMVWALWAHIFEDKRGIFNIPEDSNIIKLNFNITKKECLDYGMSYLTKSKREPLGVD